MVLKSSELSRRLTPAPVVAQSRMGRGMGDDRNQRRARSPPTPRPLRPTPAAGRRNGRSWCFAVRAEVNLSLMPPDSVRGIGLLHLRQNDSSSPCVVWTGRWMVGRASPLRQLSQCNREWMRHLLRFRCDTFAPRRPRHAAKAGIRGLDLRGFPSSLPVGSAMAWALRNGCRRTRSYRFTQPPSRTFQAWGNDRHDMETGT